MPTLLLSLILVAAALVWAASRLAVYADAIALRFNLSHSWIGILFISIITTLPEGAVTIGALKDVGSPSLALGNVFGSIMFNLAIIALIDLAFRRGGILRLSHAGSILPAVCAMIMLLGVLGMLLFPWPLAVGPLRMGAGALLLPFVFLGLLLVIKKQDAREILPGANQPPPRVRHPLPGFLVCALTVIVCATILARLGDQVAERFMLRHSFVGFILLAIITSLPELTFGIAAVRIGKYDLLLGNIMGANMINTLVIALADIVDPREILQAPGVVGMEQIFAGIMALLATAVILTAIVKRRDAKRRRFIGADSALLLLIYVLCIVAMYYGVNH